MAKIVSMSSGAIDPIAQSKRVFFRPAAADTVRVGDCVCYNHDINTDHKERSSDPTHLGLRDDDYAEGAQDRTGRLFIVEKPDAGNLEFFAGIVKALGPKAGADDDMIEIWVPNGAVLPVMCDQYCTKNLTVVGIRGGYYEGTYPGVYNGTYTSRPIGIAMETIDRSETDGLCWVKVDPTLFTRQGDYSYRLIIDDEAGSDITLNQIYVTSNQTAGTLCLQRIDGQLDGAGNLSGGIVKIRAALNAQADSICQAVSIGLTFKADAGIVYAGGGRYANAILDLAMGTSGTPDLSVAGGCTLAAINIDYHVNESGGAPTNAYPFHFNCGITYKWHGLFMSMNLGDLGDATVTTADITSQDGATDKNIPIKIANTVYYLRAFVAA